MKPATLSQNADSSLWDFDGVAGIVIGLAVWLTILVAAPLVALVLAAGLFSVELPVVVALAVLLVVARFIGLIPWTVIVLDKASGDERSERYRNLWTATRRIRSLNDDRRVNVRWAWA
jgi:hypothetical protein